MDADDRLRGSALPPVDPDAEAALAAVTHRGRRARRRRLVAASLAGCVLLAAVAGALVAALDGGEGTERVATGPTGPGRGPEGPGPTTSTEPEGSGAGVAEVAEAGDDAFWRIDPVAAPDPQATSFAVLVTRAGCNGGVTGEVLRPGVRVEADRIVVEATVEADPDGGTCPSNDEVPYVVEVGEPLGDRVLVDDACSPGREHATTSFCQADGGWAPERWDPSPVGETTTEVPGGPLLDEGAGEAAAAVVGAFLADLRAGRFDDAAHRWSGYPGSAADDPVAEVRRLVAELPALGAEAPKDVAVVPAPGWGSAAPVVVVRVGEGDEARAVAFVVSVVRGEGTIERLPELGRPDGARQGATVTGGGRIVLPAWPVEGGVRVFVDGVEVPARFDLDRGQVVVEVPSGEPGPVTVVVSAATPELPGAAAWSFVRG